jgi:YgiT-type zinc finger domain-containing protein
MTSSEGWQETFIEGRVTYTLEVNGRFILIENVPARTCVETGEQLFSPRAVEQIQQIVHGGAKPIRVVETPVYQFAE